MLTTLLLTLAPLATAPTDWISLPLPRLCEEQEHTIEGGTTSGEHLLLERAHGVTYPGSTQALVANDVANLLTLSARVAGVELALFPYAPPLLVRGSRQDLEWAERELAGLDRAGARNQIQLEAILFRGQLDEGTARSMLSAAEQGATPSTQIWRRTIMAGSSVAFGERERARFLADYDVNVATDSGVAAPVMGTLFSGKTLHLSASRVEGGARVHVRGFLDLAEAEDIQLFDPLTPDLGQLEQPAVRSLTLNFSGVVSPEQALRVSIVGAPLEVADWTLFVFARSHSEPQRLEAHDWRALDVSLLTRKGVQLGNFDPGAGLSQEARLSSLRTLAEPITAAGILSGATPRDRNSRGTAGAKRPASHIGEHLLLLSAAYVAQDESGALQALVSAMESTRLATDQVTVSQGKLRVEFPVAAGEPARLTSGRERAYLVGYDAEIAPNTWMPSPHVERAFDGLAWQGRLDSGAFRSSAWISSTDSVEQRTRDEANMGALQVLERRVRFGAAVITGAGPTELLRRTAGSAELSATLASR